VLVDCSIVSTARRKLVSLLYCWTTYAAEDASDSHAHMAHIVHVHVNCKMLFNLVAVIRRVTEVACSRFICRVYSDAGTAVLIFLCLHRPLWLCVPLLFATTCFYSWQITNLMHQFLSIYLFISNSLHVAHHQERPNCINTASGNCHSVKNETC
jgi:hypothetical protein